jgi:hypothetical protein
VRASRRHDRTTAPGESGQTPAKGGRPSAPSVAGAGLDRYSDFADGDTGAAYAHTSSTDGNSTAADTDAGASNSNVRTDGNADPSDADDCSTDGDPNFDSNRSGSHRYDRTTDANASSFNGDVTH